MHQQRPASILFSPATCPVFRRRGATSPCITIVLTDDLWVAAKLKAVRERLPLAQVVRMMLIEWVGDGALKGGTDSDGNA